MDKFWATAEDHYKGRCQSYNPAPPATLQLTDTNHNAAADAAAGAGSSSTAVAAAPGPSTGFIPAIEGGVPMCR